jgi:hypothetical protein
LSLATLKDSQGLIEDAEKLLIERWQGLIVTFGEHAPQTLLVMFELGQWYDEHTLKEKARTQYLLYVEACKKQYGPGHQFVTAALLQLKEFYIRYGEVEKANALRI